MNVMKVQGIGKSYGEREILKDIHFEIQNGEKIGLVGWNGAGKSTLIKMIIGELEPDWGSITFWPNNMKDRVSAAIIKNGSAFRTRVERSWRSASAHGQSAGVTHWK